MSQLIFDLDESFIRGGSLFGSCQSLTITNWTKQLTTQEVKTKTCYSKQSSPVIIETSLPFANLHRTFPFLLEHRAQVNSKHSNEPAMKLFSRQFVSDLLGSLPFRLESVLHTKKARIVLRQR